MSGARAEAALEEALGHHFEEPDRLALALTHPSQAHEIDGSRGNERLEFLGDAVLDLVVTRLLYDAHPSWREGDLTRARAALVNTRSLAARARELDLGVRARLGRTEARSGGAEKNRILANLFEAVLGALYLDGGLAPVEQLARRLFADALVTGSPPLPRDPKTGFQEWAHAARQPTPRYRTLRDSGVENDEERFEVEVRLGEEIWGRGCGRTKRHAERAAAEAALRRADPGPR